jgi:hypothetical protein
MADASSSLFSARNLRRTLPWVVIVVAALVLPVVLPPSDSTCWVDSFPSASWPLALT